MFLTSSRALSVLAVATMVATLYATTSVTIRAQDTPDEAAIKDVILRFNHASERATDLQDPSIEQELTTDEYYREIAQQLEAQWRSGVDAVDLRGLDWGQITVAGDTATAVTFETWGVFLADGTVQVSSPERNMYQLVRQEGSWKIRADDHPDEPVAAPSTPRAPSAEGITEFRVPTVRGDPAGIAAGSDGALWFTESNGAKIGRITVDGTITEFRLPTARDLPVRITPAPDGALWFVDGESGQIGRITTAGAVTKFTIPALDDDALLSGDGRPLGITSGPDGALWFTRIGAPRIGRMTTTGAVTNFPIQGETGAAIAAGPDGALWFTEPNANRIGRITTSGQVTELPLPKEQSTPLGIAAGPDGAMWFTEPLLQQIGRITSDGIATEYPIPSDYCHDGCPEPVIVSGPDGAMWFTEGPANQIGRITVGGTVTEYAVPTANAFPLSIVAGPDGAMWFTEPGANQIGRIKPGP